MRDHTRRNGCVHFHQNFFGRAPTQTRAKSTDNLTLVGVTLFIPVDSSGGMRGWTSIVKVSLQQVIIQCHICLGPHTRKHQPDCLSVSLSLSLPLSLSSAPFTSRTLPFADYSVPHQEEGGGSRRGPCRPDGEAEPRPSFQRTRRPGAGAVARGQGEG